MTLFRTIVFQASIKKHTHRFKNMVLLYFEQGGKEHEKAIFILVRAFDAGAVWL